VVEAGIVVAARRDGDTLRLDLPVNLGQQAIPGIGFSQPCSETGQDRMFGDVVFQFQSQETHNVKVGIGVILHPFVVETAIPNAHQQHLEQ